MALHSEIKFRCDAELSERFRVLSERERRNVSDLARIVLEDWVTRRESEIGFQTPQKAQVMHLAEQLLEVIGHAKTDPAPAAPPTSYKKTKSGKGK